MSSASDDSKGPGRRGAGRGRGRQTPAQTPQAPGESRLTLASYPTPAEATGRRETESSDSASAKGSPPASDIEAKMKGLEIIAPITRPGFGVVGSRVKVLANHYEIRLAQQLVVTQYHVDVTHDVIKLSRDDKRLIFWTCVANNMDVFKNVHTIAYDGDHILISLNRLNFGGRGEGAEAGKKYSVDVRLPRKDRKENFAVSISAVGYVHVDPKSAIASGTANLERYTTSLQVFDLLFRQRRAFPLDAGISNNWYTFASTVYRIPPEGKGSPLSGGRVIWQGLFAAARVGQSFTPFINFDVSHSGFYRPQSVLEFLVEILNDNFGRKFSVRQLDSSTTLTPEWVRALNRAIKGLKVTMRTIKANGESIELEHTVNQVLNVTALTHKFPQRQPDGTERELTVAQYFHERYGPMKYPNLNLLHIGPRNKKCYVPMEHCTLAYNQRVKKLNPADTSTMIRAAAMTAPSRKDKICDLVNKSEFVADPWLQTFGVQVNNNMKQVEGRILTPPDIQYGQQNGRNSIVKVREGVWDMRGQKFLYSAGCQRIGALILDKRDREKYIRFFNFLLCTCADLGMQVTRSINESAVFNIDPAETEQIEKEMTHLKEMGAEFIIVALPQKGSPHYCEVKRVAEIVLGVMSQCVVKANIMKCLEKNDRMTATNIALKMNMKMGGINSLAQSNELTKQALFAEPTLVLGIDVTHPAATEKKMPSISSVVGNLDDSFMRYAASIRVQKHRREAIVAGHLDQLVRERLIEYCKSMSNLNAKHKTNKPTRPSRIIIFRDGVAESQFKDILKDEMAGIRQACKDLDPNYRPKITLIISQKRHHTRFFPEQNGPSSGKGFNIVPGTVVDNTITHPDLFEFYLCSHFGIQGTSRPIRYHVLHDDSKFSSDHMQAVAFYLCHAYSRCTRAVSLPAPVYFADLACRRARAHIFNKVSDFGSDVISQHSGTAADTHTGVSEDELIRSSTVTDSIKMRMYFV